MSIVGRLRYLGPVRSSYLVQVLGGLLSGHAMLGCSDPTKSHLFVPLLANTDAMTLSGRFSESPEARKTLCVKYCTQRGTCGSTSHLPYPQTIGTCPDRLFLVSPGYDSQWDSFPRTPQGLVTWNQAEPQDSEKSQCSALLSSTGETL